MRTNRSPHRSARSPKVATRRLCRSCDEQPGWQRVRRGKGFVYLDARARRITSPHTLERIRRLTIPPAYDDVWICPDPAGHLQATGRDARGRKQYRYHPLWREQRDSRKFRRIRLLGKALPALRRRLLRDLQRPQLDRERVLAAAILLLDATGLRVGAEAYLRDNGSHGLTTLRDRHLRTDISGARLHFRGKGRIALDLGFDHPRLLHTLRACRRLPGTALLQYVDGNRVLRLSAAEVNAHLRKLTGERISSKDFRTWKASVRFLQILHRDAVAGHRDRRRLSRAISEIAAELGNTAAVCRRAYLDPAIVEAWRESRLCGLVPVRASGLRMDERRYLALAQS